MYLVMYTLALISLAAIAAGSQAGLRQALEEDSCNSERDGKALLQRTTSAKMQGASSPEFQALVINLDTRPDRWEHVTQELSQVADGFLEYERLPGVNGSSIGPSEESLSATHDYIPVIQELVHDWYGLDLPGPMADVVMQFAQRAPTWSDGERGCAMSHITAWRQVAQGTEPMLIFEDDTVLPADFAETLRESRGILESNFGGNVDILFLQYNTFAKMMNLTIAESEHITAFREKVADLGNRSLLKSDFLLDSGSYLLWPSGAQKLLGALPLNYTAGFIMSLKVHRGEMEGFAIDPPLVKQLWMTDPAAPAAINNIEKLTK